MKTLKIGKLRVYFFLSFYWLKGRKRRRKR